MMPFIRLARRAIGRFLCKPLLTRGVSDRKFKGAILSLFYYYLCSLLILNDI